VGRVKRIGVDLEADGFHHFRGKICLIQISTPDKILLIDPLAFSWPREIVAFLEDPEVEVIMHSADYDVRSLDRDMNVRIRNLFDTSIAAAFVGFSSLGLANVVREVFGVELPKSKRLQRSDWSRRPLSEEALVYAAADVLHLLPLADSLSARLEGLGRTAWVREECRYLTTVRFSPPVPPVQACLEAKGVAKLTPEERAVFRELYLFREAEAQKKDVPSFRIFGNDFMLGLAREPDKPLEESAGMSATVLRRYGSGLRDALARGRRMPPIFLPRRDGYPPKRFSAQDRKCLEDLKTWRKARGGEHGLDPALLWPLGHLEAIVRGGLTPQEAMAPELCTHHGVRVWQQEVFGESLRQCLAAMDPGGSG